MSDIAKSRETTEKAAKTARNYLSIFVLAIIVVGLLVGIYKGEPDIPIPYIDLDVPANFFYSCVPFLLIILHLIVLGPIVRFYNVANSLLKEIEKSDNPKKELDQTSVTPFDFVLTLLYKIRRPTIRKRPPFWRIFHYLRYVISEYGYLFLLSVIVAIPIFILPLSILIWIQTTYLSFYLSSENKLITLIYPCTISIEFILQIVFIWRLGVIRKFRAPIVGNRSWIWIKCFSRLVIATTIFFVLLAPVACSWLLVLDGWLAQYNPLQKLVEPQDTLQNQNRRDNVGDPPNK